MSFTRYSVPTAKFEESVSVPDTVFTPETLIPKTVLPVATSVSAGSSKRHFTMKLSDAGGEPKLITEVVSILWRFVAGTPSTESALITYPGAT